MHQLHSQKPTHSPDSISSCFICLQDCPINPSSSKNGATRGLGSSFSLRNVFRFLELLHGYDGTSDSRRKLLLFKNQCNNPVVVPVCGGCSEMAKEFTDLYHLLEVTRLRLIWCLRRMEETMSKAEKRSRLVPARTNKVKERGNGRFDDTLRTGAKGLIQAIVPLPPIVLLQKTPHPFKSKSRPISDNLPSPSSSFLQQEADVIRDGPSPKRRKIDVKRQITKPQEKRRLRSKRKTTRKIVFKFYDCPYCRGRFRKKFKLTQHLLQYHCEHFFPHDSHKLDTVSPSEFQLILVELLWKDLIEVEEQKECCYCDRKFGTGCTTSNPNTKEDKQVLVAEIKKHFIDAHYKELEERLLAIQKDSNLPEKLEGVSGNGKFCECGVYLSGRYHYYVVHDKYYCILKKAPEDASTPFSRVIPREIDDVKPLQRPNNCTASVDAARDSLSFSKYKSKPKNKSCSFCRGRFRHNIARRGHMVIYHCEHLFPNHKLDSVTDLQYKKILADLLFRSSSYDAIDEEKCCPYCHKEFTLTWNRNFRYKLHMASEHYAELEKKLIEIQKDPDLNTKLAMASSQGRVCELCGMYLSTPFHQISHDKRFCPKKAPEEEVAVPTPRQRIPEDDGFKLMFDPFPGNKKKTVCKLCNTVMVKAFAQRHWNYSCPKGKRLPLEEKKKRIRSKYDYAERCPYCRYESQSRDPAQIVQYHIVGFHPEHFLLQALEGEEEVVEALRGKKSLLQRVLVDMVLPECLQKVGKSLCCCFCDVNLLRHDASRAHVLFQHRNEVMKRVLESLNLEDVEERLKRCNPKGISCPCGVYVPCSGRWMNMGNHEKFLCKLSSTEDEVKLP